MNSILKKMQVKNQSVIHVLNAPDDLEPIFKDFETTLKVQKGTINSSSPFILGFAKTLKEIEEIASYAEFLEPEGLFWICYPKGSSKKYTCEFNRDNGWTKLGELGFEPVRQIAFDEDWSALRFKRVGDIKKMTRSFAYTAEGKEKASKK
jgi:hypothetical protein